MNHTKANRKRAIKILSLLLALAICIWFLQSYILCDGDSNKGRISGFYLEDRDSIDVVLIGASDVYSAFSPCYAYEKYGFTSYPFATEGNIITNYKTQIQIAEKRQHPKLIVVEVNGALYASDKTYQEEARFRRFVDNIPFGQDKLDLIAEYTKENKDQNPWEFIFPIIKYHSIWKELNQSPIWCLSVMQCKLRGYTYMKGTNCKTKIYDQTDHVYNYELKDRSDRKELNGYAREKLLELLDYCRDEQIDNVVFVRVPHQITKEKLDSYDRSSTVGDIVTEYGYDYINFDTDFADMGLDLSKDFYDLEHLNIYGQRKFTEYFGNILKERYGIAASDLTPEQKKTWDVCADYYEDISKECYSLIERNKFRNVGEDYPIKKWLEERFPFVEDLLDKYEK